MAEITVDSKNGRRKIVAPRIDLTPMVDLGFLLITFFMYTTTMAKAKTMEINMPSTEQTSNPTAFIAESTITIIAGDKHLFYCYYGIPDNTKQLTRANSQNLRDIIIKKKLEALHLSTAYSAEAHKLHVLIKPSQTCTYNDIVTVLDEMQINSIPYFAMADITEYEKQWINTSK